MALWNIAAMDLPEETEPPTSAGSSASPSVCSGAEVSTSMSSKSGAEASWCSKCPDSGLQIFANKVAATSKSLKKTICQRQRSYKRALKCTGQIAGCDPLPVKKPNNKILATIQRARPDGVSRVRRSPGRHASKGVQENTIPRVSDSKQRRVAPRSSYLQHMQKTLGGAACIEMGKATTSTQERMAKAAKEWARQALRGDSAVAGPAEGKAVGECIFNATASESRRV